MIKRPKKVQKGERNYLSNEKYQDYSEQQFNNIYNYLDNQDTVISKSYSNTSMKVGNMQFFKVGRIVFFQSYGDATNLPNEVNDYISIDEEFRPLAEARFSPINTTAYYMLRIKTDLSVQINNYTHQPVTSATNCAFNGCYISAN